MNDVTRGNALSENELLHLAIEASNRERYDLSIGYLKQAIAVPGPLAAKTHFLLGTQYAQIGMYEDAERFMQLAVTFEPEFDIAVFQLGLLQLTSGKPDAAEASWQGLDFLPAGHGLNHFRRGMLALQRNALAEAETELRAGLATPLPNAPLLAEMQRITDNIVKMRAEAGDAPAEEGQGEAGDEHLFLSAYRH